MQKTSSYTIYVRLTNGEVRWLFRVPGDLPLAESNLRYLQDQAEAFGKPRSRYWMEEGEPRPETDGPRGP